MKAAASFTLRTSDIKVRKVLPTHLVALRVFKSRKAYDRRANARACRMD